jgi:hypothetical protein
MDDSDPNPILLPPVPDAPDPAAKHAMKFAALAENRKRSRRKKHFPLDVCLAPASERKPWDRQPHESKQAFEAFTAYREMGRQQSYTLLSKTLKKNRGMIGLWGSRWNWQARILAWEEHLDKERQKAEEDYQREQVRKLREHGDVLGASLMAAASTGSFRLNKDLQDNKGMRLKPQSIAQLAATGFGIRSRALEPRQPASTTVNVNQTQAQIQNVSVPDIREKFVDRLHRRLARELEGEGRADARSDR